MKQKELPKWSERTLFEKVLTCLTVFFAILAIIFIILETVQVNIPNKLDSIFIYLELMCMGILNYKYYKYLSIFIIVWCIVFLTLTLINTL